MFFPQTMKIKSSDLVLEIGPGAYPYWRSDCLADKFDASSEVDLAQFGGDTLKTKGKPLFKITDNELPFKDKSFDYVICSHVFEHVPADELPQLASEIMRVAGKAYIEFPRPLYDFCYNFDVHVNLMDIVNGEVICLDKSRTKFHELKQFQSYLFEMRNTQKFVIDATFTSLCAVGYEFSGAIPIRFVDTLEEFLAIVDKNEYELHKPSLAWMIKNKFTPFRIKKAFTGEKSSAFFEKFLRTK